MSEDKKTLLLDATYQVISFISFKKTLKLVVRDKVEIESNWDDDICWASGSIKFPSVLRLKNHFKRNFYNCNFSRQALIKRDKSQCQYCGKKLPASQITIDHVLPRSLGGINSFTNCVVSCTICNNKKADRTPEQAEMLLLNRPTHPSFSVKNFFPDIHEYWHKDWDYYLK